MLFSKKKVYFSTKTTKTKALPKKKYQMSRYVPGHELTKEIGKFFYGDKVEEFMHQIGITQAEDISDWKDKMSYNNGGDKGLILDFWFTKPDSTVNGLTKIFTKIDKCDAFGSVAYKKMVQESDSFTKRIPALPEKKLIASAPKDVPQINFAKDFSGASNNQLQKEQERLNSDIRKKEDILSDLNVQIELRQREFQRISQAPRQQDNSRDAIQHYQRQLEAAKVELDTANRTLNSQNFRNSELSDQVPLLKRQLESALEEIERLSKRQKETLPCDNNGAPLKVARLYARTKNVRFNGVIRPLENNVFQFELPDNCEVYIDTKNLAVTGSCIVKEEQFKDLFHPRYKYVGDLTYMELKSIAAVVDSNETNFERLCAALGFTYVFIITKINDISNRTEVIHYLKDGSMKMIQTIIGQTDGSFERLAKALYESGFVNLLREKPFFSDGPKRN
jgi:hypothetical protein